MASFQTNVSGPSNTIVASIAGDTRYTPGQTLDYFFGDFNDEFYGFDPISDLGLLGFQTNFRFDDEMEAAFAAASLVANINFNEVNTQTSADLSYY